MPVTTAFGGTGLFERLWRKMAETNIEEKEGFNEYFRMAINYRFMAVEFYGNEKYFNDLYEKFWNRQ